MTGFFDLKSAADAKEYLQRVGIEYRFQCYHENRPDGCHRLGDYLEAFQHEYNKAQTVYSKNCIENKYGPSCFKLGNYHMLGRACKKNPLAAMTRYRDGCEYGHGASCHNAALLLQSGQSDPSGQKDFVTASKYLHRGCCFGDIPACQLLSTYYITGKEGIPKDMTKAFGFAKIACDNDHMYACHNLSRMYARGEGTAKDEKLADVYRQKALDRFKSIEEGEREIKFGE